MYHSVRKNANLDFCTPFNCHPRGEAARDGTIPKNIESPELTFRCRIKDDVVERLARLIDTALTFSRFHGAPAACLSSIGCWLLHAPLRH